MTPEQVGLLVESWDAVAGRREEIARAFYQVLFERHPELRPLFTRTDMRSQYEKFAGMVDEIVRLRTDPKQFVKSAVMLGQRHAAYGVSRDHYGPAGAALLKVLADALGPAFTPAVHEAWSEGYLLMSSIMARAAERAPVRRAAS
jgi:hemoglobin-like flavoprotein